jgi:cytidylate kinase
MSLERSIAIDGPAGAGKSTVARMLAHALGYRYVSTGDLYRALALEVLRRGLDPYNEAAVLEVAKSVSMRVEPTGDGAQRTILNNEDVTDEIRTAEVDAIVSPVSVYVEVRKHMVEAQRAIAFDVDVVMDGRDIGTVVLAESAHKFYLTASPEERARRRQRDYARKGCHVELADLVDEINRRDEVDSTRQVSPLRPAPDAVLIDCTTLSPEEVVETMLAALGRPDACCIISQNP